MIPTRIHGVLDYLVGAALVATGMVLAGRQDPTAGGVMVVVGIGTLVYSLLTSYEMGAIRLIPMPVHLLIDFAGGVLLAVSPWLLGFADVVWLPHVIFGAAEVGVVLLSSRVPRSSHLTPGNSPRAPVVQ